MIKRIALSITGMAFGTAGAALIFKNGWLFRAVEKFRDNHPVTRVLDPLSRINTLGLSKISSIFIGIMMLFISILLILLAVFGEMAF